MYVVIDPHQLLFLREVQLFREMASSSKQTRRTPHNVYTQKRADQEFQDFVQYSKSKNLPIPNLPILASSSKRSQAIDDSDNHPNAPKRQKLPLGQVHFNFVFFFRSSLMFARIQPAQIRMETKLFPLSTVATT